MSNVKVGEHFVKWHLDNEQKGSMYHEWPNIDVTYGPFVIKFNSEVSHPVKLKCFSRFPSIFGWMVAGEVEQMAWNSNKLFVY